MGLSKTKIRSTVHTYLLVPLWLFCGEEGCLGTLCFATELELYVRRLFPATPVQQLPAFDRDSNQDA